MHITYTPASITKKRKPACKDTEGDPAQKKHKDDKKPGKPRNNGKQQRNDRDAIFKECFQFVSGFPLYDESSAAFLFFCKANST